MLNHVKYVFNVYTQLKLSDSDSMYQWVENPEMDENKITSSFFNVQVRFGSVIFLIF